MKCCFNRHRRKHCCSTLTLWPSNFPSLTNYSLHALVAACLEPVLVYWPQRNSFFPPLSPPLAHLLTNISQKWHQAACPGGLLWCTELVFAGVVHRILIFNDLRHRESMKTYSPNCHNSLCYNTLCSLYAVFLSLLELPVFGWMRFKTTSLFS